MRKKNSPGNLVAAAKTLPVEVLSMRGMHSIDNEPLTAGERVWASDFLVLPPHIPWIQPKKTNIAILKNKNEL